MTDPLFWFGLLCFAVIMYVVLDGFDLGLGILYPWFEDEKERGRIMSSVAHVWDGNETWLVFGGVILFAAFPGAYATFLSGLYLPLCLMLVALIFRGVAFEYRFKAETSTLWWDRAFGIGSTVAAICQGIVLGNIVQGNVGVEASTWLTPFALFTGFSVAVGYALLGCGWMLIKGNARIRKKVAHLAQYLVVLLLICLAIVSIWTLMTQPLVSERWTSLENLLPLLPIPLLSTFIGWQIWNICRKSYQHNYRVLILTIALFFLGFIGLWAGMHPYFIPGKMTFYDVIAPDSSLEFTFWGVIILVPIILGYTAFNYKVFAGMAPEKPGGYD
ncbi:cytochrome d ubiquinol oxidase subunit II [Algicola sagamiensis]|uniref:cytochrome d ubiquinol oxidase subunit II n=1 Tax=Algicola sagamiensis TaxID=163869 RepID=UPI00037EDF78|nr:cytochrome d ubiquinol oxidase subunit II [Algicola sagamiensis]